MKPVVLFVDDEPNLLNATVRVLRNQPFQLFTARSAQDAMGILKTHQVHLIVCDEQMPGMSGSDLLAWVAKTFPEVVRVVLTGRPDVNTMIKAINEGRVFRYLTKPCNEFELAMTIHDGLASAGVEVEPVRQAASAS